MPKENWDDLRIVLALHRAGSVAAAARALGVDETTVARRLKTLQTRLGARLFERAGGRVHATAAGEQLAATAERIDDEMASVREAVVGSDDRVAGGVHLTAVPIIVNRVLIPALPVLRAQHPALQIRIAAQSRSLHIGQREADVAVRMARPSHDLRAVARRVATLRHAAYARADLDPRRLAWIGYEDGMSGLPPARWVRDCAARTPACAVALTVNDAEAILAAVQAGLGRSILPVALADRVPGLTRLETDPTWQREVWVLVHPQLRGLGRIRATVQWLEAELGRLDDASH